MTQVLERPAAAAATKTSEELDRRYLLTDEQVMSFIVRGYHLVRPELPEGFERRFSRDEGCPQAEEFGDVGAIIPVFDAHRDRLTELAKSVPVEQLDRRLEKPIAFAKTFGEALSFIAMHTSMHAGQIVIIRRSLGRPPLM